MTLTDFLVRKGMTQEDLVSRKVLRKSVVSRFLNGESMLSTANCARVVSFTKGRVSFQDLIREYEQLKRAAQVSV